MIGDLDRRIYIYTHTNITNTLGEVYKSRSLLKTVWAKIEPDGGGEATEANKVTATGRVVFTIRYRTGLNEAKEIKFDDEYYDILTIEKPDRKRYLEITGEKKY